MALCSNEVEPHALFNNAGAMSPPIAQISEDLYDYSWATNVMGPYLLTTLLTPALLAGAKYSADSSARVINTASIMQRLGGINFDTLVNRPARIKFWGTALYCQSKNVSHLNIAILFLNLPLDIC